MAEHTIKRIGGKPPNMYTGDALHSLRMMPDNMVFLSEPNEYTYADDGLGLNNGSRALSKSEFLELKKVIAGIVKEYNDTVVNAPLTNQQDRELAKVIFIYFVLTDIMNESNCQQSANGDGGILD